MSKIRNKGVRSCRGVISFLLLLAFGLVSAQGASATDKKHSKGHKGNPPKAIDYSNIVWPNPPAIARIRYVNWWASEKQQRNQQGNVQKKSKWMDRLAGTQTQEEVFNLPFSLVQPGGMAIDSKGRVYIPDSKVGAVFIIDPETRDSELLKHGVNGNFTHIIDVAMDDNDRLFISDPILKHVLVLDANHKPEDVITEGMVRPTGLAIDTKNRLLYVADTELDQVLVYDADSFKLVRKLGTTGHNHELTTPGDFSKPTGLTVDQEGNLYVCDTMNNRIEVFDADGTFLEAYGKNGDAPPNFARPKGVAIDSDGHIWVADGVQDRVSVFNKQWQLLISIGGHGLAPGQFSGLMSIASDTKRNRMYTTEIYPGRMQEFRYVTDAEAEQLRKERQDKRMAERASANASATAPTTTPSEPADSTQPK
ncbi:MAG TPA: SMP-30/gluconolactonase/LRE family protein [Terriglobales bacterium]|nr:SMP-30/gluconolactonase/LRE family protein [Terriglobales bacterium]